MALLISHRILAMQLSNWKGGQTDCGGKLFSRQDVSGVLAHLAVSPSLGGLPRPNQAGQVFLAAEPRPEASVQLRGGLLVIRRQEENRAWPAIPLSSVSAKCIQSLPVYSIDSHDI
eukprot:scaffold400782_cov17-Prasinocladus_malaysianus.AAC.1